MNKTVKIVGIAVFAGVLAFAVFGIMNYFYVDTVFHNSFGGHIWDVSKQDISEIKQSQEKMNELRAEFNRINNR